MALRNILTDSDPTLRKKSREVVKFDDRIGQLVDDMKETLVSAQGLGLAAPQVGVLRRIFVILHGEEIIEFINPEILEQEGAVEHEEGCLSLPGWTGIVTRPEKVKVRAYNRNGEQFEMEFEEMEARAICHENDHLDGILYIDRSKEVFDTESGDDIPEARWKQKDHVIEQG